MAYINNKPEMIVATVSGIIIELATVAEMEAALVPENEGKIYKYTGETSGDYVNGDLYIVENIPEFYSITAVAAFATAAADNPTTIAREGTAVLTFTPNSGFVLPATITVSGAEYVYNSVNGTVTLSNPSDNVRVTLVATRG